MATSAAQDDVTANRTQRDSLATLRATLGRMLADAEPTVLALPALRLLAYAERRGLDRAGLVRAVGLADAALVDARAHIPARCLYALWARVARQLRDPALPFVVAHAVRPEDYDVLGFALLTSPSARHAIERLLRSSRMITDAGDWAFESRGALAEITWRRTAPLSLGVRLGNEVALAMAVQMMRAIVPSVRAVRVRFRHRRPSDAAPHAAFFRCPVQFGQRQDSVAFLVSALDAAPRLANPAMERHFDAAIEDRLADLPARSIAARVRRALSDELGGGAPTMRQVARRLALSERTLRRRLDRDGIGFRAMIADVRREEAARWLRDTDASVADIARALGFSDTTALSRAYRRWFGESPNRARARR